MKRLIKKRKNLEDVDESLIKIIIIKKMMNLMTLNLQETQVEDEDLNRKLTMS